MRGPLIFSSGFHIAVFVFAIYGLPSTNPKIVMENRVIEVEVVSVTETPTPRVEPEPAPPPKVTKPAPPPPPPPKPVPTEAPPSQVAALPPEPEPVPVPEPKPKPVKAQPKPPEKPKPAPQAKPAPPKVAPRPKVKPRPDFASMMLKTVEKLKDAPPPEKKPEKKKKQTFDEKMASLMKRKSIASPERAQRAPLGQNLTISEIDAIKRQIERCWLVTAGIGAKDAEEMIVKIRIKLNPDGTLRESRIVDRFRVETNATYKAVAESALRAIRNPRCNKFNLPVQKFDVWKDMVLHFNPSEMVGR